MTIDSAFIYTDFSKVGTTAGVLSYYRELDSSKANLLRIEKKDLEKLNSVLTTVLNKRLYQKKYGGELIYLLLYSRGEQIKAVLSNSSRFFMLDDLTNMRYWVSEDSLIIGEIEEILKNYQH